MATLTKRGDHQRQAKVRRRGINSSATFETKARAEAWARQTESDIDAGRFQQGRVEADRTTLHEALERHLNEVVPREKGIKQSTGIGQRIPLAVLRSR